MYYKKSRKAASKLHIAIAVFQLFYIYTPLHGWHYALPIVQWVTFPLLSISGLWLWKGKKLWSKLQAHSRKKRAIKSAIFSLPVSL